MGVVDADVWGFSIPRMLGVTGDPVVIDSMSSSPTPKRTLSRRLPGSIWVIRGRTTIDRNSAGPAMNTVRSPEPACLIPAWTALARASTGRETRSAKSLPRSVATMPTWVRSNRRHPSRRSRETIFEETDAGAMPSSSAALEIEPLRYTATKARNVSHDTLSVRPPMCVRLSAVVASASDYSSPTGE